jgi:hypothetical protein
MQSTQQLNVDLSSHFNNPGIASSCHRAVDGLDGTGTVFCAASLPPSRAVIDCNGTQFVFPDKCDGIEDNIACEGQEIPLPVGAYSHLHFLGMSDWRAFEEPILLKYSDGTCVEKTLGLSDASHYKGLLFKESEAIVCRLVSPDSLIPHIHLFNISPPADDYQMKEAYLEAGIWHQVIPAEAPRLLAGIVLPDNPSMHLFALTLITVDEASL